MPALVAAMAVLLGGGVLAATTVEPAGRVSTVAADGRVASLASGEVSLLQEQASVTTTTVAPPTSTAAPRPSTTRPTTSSTRAPATTTTSIPRTVVGGTYPGPPGPSIAPASSWQAADEGISARMRLEPAAPVAGQAVRFVIEYSGEFACCYVFLHFGDDTPRFSLHNDWACNGASPLSPGAHRTVVTHTYAEPGAYRAWLQVLDGDLCTLPPVPGPGEPVRLHNLDIHACVAVGPATPTGGCEGLPTFGPIIPR